VECLILFTSVHLGAGMLVKSFDFKSEIIDVDFLVEKIKELKKRYPNTKIEVRLGLAWDDWNNESHPIKLCVYKKEN
jgi:hypothetical protein